MRRLFFYPLIAALACVGIVLWAGCNQSPLPGIEVANPDVEPESVRIVPEAGNEIYHVLLLDEASAAVDQLESVTGGQNLLDSVVVPYARLGPSITLQATFSNRRRIAVSATFGTEAGTVDGTLQVDGLPAPACFEIPGLSPSCDAGAAPKADGADGPDGSALAADTAEVMEGEIALAKPTEPEETQENLATDCRIAVFDDNGAITFVDCNSLGMEGSGGNSEETMIFSNYILEKNSLVSTGEFRLSPHSPYAPQPNRPGPGNEEDLR